MCLSIVESQESPQPFMVERISKTSKKPCVTDRPGGLGSDQRAGVHRAGTRVKNHRAEANARQVDKTGCKEQHDKNHSEPRKTVVG